MISPGSAVSGLGVVGEEEEEEEEEGEGGEEPTVSLA